MKELDNRTYNKITQLCNDGDVFMESGDHKKAIKAFTKALGLIPSPKTDWEAATWVYTAIGDACFSSEDYVKASESFYNALNCPDGITNPFILLRLGQSLFESGQTDKAKEYLLKAYMLDGDKIFDDEDEKYFNLIKPDIHQ